jgi:hypothetical protein
MDKEGSILLLNDYVSLPIIISDYDAAVANKRHASTSTTDTSIGATEPRVSSETSSESTSNPKWNTGFSQFADELWDRMTGGMKAKLREACVEVLKRTDDSKHEPSDRWGDHDDNTRLLD